MMKNNLKKLKKFFKTKTGTVVILIVVAPLLIVFVTTWAVYLLNIASFNARSSSITNPVDKAPMPVPKLTTTDDMYQSTSATPKNTTESVNAENAVSAELQAIQKNIDENNQKIAHIRYCSTMNDKYYSEEKADQKIRSDNLEAEYKSGSGMTMDGWKRFSNIIFNDTANTYNQNMISVGCPEWADQETNRPV